MIGAEATVLDARGGLYNSMSPLLPNLRISATRFNSITTREEQSGVDFQFGQTLPYTSTFDNEVHGTNPSLSGSWNILNLSIGPGIPRPATGCAPPSSIARRPATTSRSTPAASSMRW